MNANRWYHSGLEGYCKAAARLMNLPDNNSGWGNFGRDLFADGRFDNPAKASKAWTLSRFRSQGRSSRLKLFEQSWLGEQGRQYELEAIHTCVHNMCGKGGESALYELYLNSPDTFAKSFHDLVLPAIGEGFAAERYHPSDIACFSQGIDKALARLDPALPQTFRNFAIPLVAGIVYGPDHAAVRSGSNSATLRRRGDGGARPLPAISVDDNEIVLTQLFCDNVGIVGDSCRYEQDSVILLGRGADPADYRHEAGDELAGVLDGRKTLLFPMAQTHKSTSRSHGMIVRIGETWYYHDFSTNGSYIENASQPSAVHRGAVALAPGDRIYLGLAEPPANADDAYRLASAILVSFRADESSF